MQGKYNQIVRRITYIVLFVWLPLIGACSFTAKDKTQERVSLSKSACIDEGHFIPRIVIDENEEIKASVLAGGTVRSGDFLISLFLVCDPSLSSDDPMNDNYSEVRYLALSYASEYLGDPLDEEIKVSMTINDEITGTAILSGSNNDQIFIGRGATTQMYGPINTKNQLVAQSLVAGKLVDFLLTISTAKPLAAAHLTASFEETTDGYLLLNAEIVEKH